MDIDQNGTIDYDEWVLATVDKENVLTHRYLKKAFNHFDKDENSNVSMAEIRDNICI